MLRWREIETDVDADTLDEALTAARQDADRDNQVRELDSQSPGYRLAHLAISMFDYFEKAVGKHSSLAAVGLFQFFVGYQYAMIERRALDEVLAEHVKDERGAGHDGNEG